MHCEYCDISFEDLTASRRHMLSVSHVRTKRNYDLSTTNLRNNLIQATIHPKDFCELVKLINIHSRKDVVALEEMNFFNIETKTDSKIARELIRVLNTNLRDFYLENLPPELKQPILESYKKHFKPRYSL